MFYHVALLCCVGTVGDVQSDTDHVVSLLLNNLTTPSERYPALKSERAVRHSFVLPIPSVRQAVLPQLLKSLRSKDLEECRAAYFLLQGAGPAIASSVPELIKIYKSGDCISPKAIPSILGTIGPQASDAVPLLTQSLGHADPEHRVRCAYALWRISLKSESPCKVFKDIMESKAPDDAKRLACYCSGEVGREAAHLVPLLKTFFVHEDFLVRFDAAEACVKITRDCKEGEDILLEILKDTNPANIYERLRSALALSRSKEHQKLAIDTALDEAREANRNWYSIITLGSMPLDNKTKLSALIPALDDKSPFVRQLSALEIGKLGKDAHVAIDFLRRLDKDEDGLVRLQAKTSISQLLKPQE